MRFSRTPKATAAELLEVRAEISALRAELTKRTNDLSLVTAAANALDQRISALDARVAATSAELTNQLHELGGDIERLAGLDHGPGVPGLIEEIRQGQVRLASEQARYAIAFRADLASLAESLRPAIPTVADED